MEVDAQERHDVSMKDAEQDNIEVSTVGTPSSRGDVLRIVDQTIDDGGAVKYTVVWENGDTTEESVEALGQWDDLVQDYEHSQFSKSEVKSNTPSPPPTQARKSKGDGDSSKRRISLASRPTRTKAKANVQYFEGGDDSDDGGEYSGSRGGKKVNKSKKATSSGDDVQDQDQDTPPASTVSARGYPRRAAQSVIKTQRPIESSEGSSDESAPQKSKVERKTAATATGAVPKSKRTIAATSTDSSFVQAHHPFCTRCGQRGEVSKRKSKKKSDDEDDDEPLGSLLLCECCSAGYHRACLRKTYTDSLIGTGFRCEACIKTKGAECLECHEWVGRTPPPTPAAAKPADVTAMDTNLPTDATATVPVSVAEGGTAAADGVAADTMSSTDGTPAEDNEKPAAVTDGSPSTITEDPAEPTVEPPTILFRCFRCTYTAHDRCLKRLSTMEPGVSQTEIIRQYRKDWKCHQCLEWDMELDLILAFRDVPIQLPSASTPISTDTQDADVEMQLADTPNPSTPSLSESTTKDGITFPQAPNTTRELLIKWKNMSYRKLTWVPAYWVSQVVSPAKIKSFWKRTPAPAEISDVVPQEWLQVEKVLDVIFDTEYDGSEDDMDALDHIQSVFVKWKSLDYDQSTWDEPDEPDSPHYASFKAAFKDWVAAQKIQIPSRAKKGRSGVQPRPANQPPFAELKEQPAYISGGTLKDYQMDGLNWLRYNHSKGVNSILADEMGLGKTIQMVAFVNTLFHQLKAFPCLIVVPNSTLTNWVREFAKWSPDLRVVAYYGPQSSRSVVRDHELFHRGTHDLKCHVVVTTYEMIVNVTDSALFRKNSWECLVVDEGQRLKNENSMLFVKLNELVIENRVLLTGTPLQNNIRELFSLMNFLDPVQFADVTELEKKYENLDKSAVEELHGLLKPFFLRRTKDEVLKDLPPMSEVIVPVGMSALQKEIYKGILARNHKLLQSITNRGGTASSRKASLHNILMELRKCLNHPYLIEGVEPRYLNTAELVHKSLIEAGGKLELLHNMLPKLKANGHRILIFSTMTRLLDILEDYLNGERYNFVRLDGSTSSNDRQARIDKFNAPDSDVFVFLLSTRAGGVGVNLATADTILIYDVDFNPKADMQALSRAHRIGQKNKVLVLKFMTRNSAEERIVQIGKKKMILDHLIVERMEDENLDPVDVESILKFGAKALFEEESTTNEDVKYDDAALDALLDRSKIERNKDDENGESKVGGFGFAKVWTETKGFVDEEIPIDAPPETEEQGFWSTLLRDRLAMAYAQEEETLGRGARRKTVLSYAENGNNNESPTNKKRKAGKEVPKEEEEDYVDQEMAGSDAESGDSDAGGDPENVINELDIGKRSKKSKGLAHPDANQSPLQPTDMEGLEDGSRPGGEHYTNADGTVGKVKKARMQPPSPYQMHAGPGGMLPGRGGAAMDAAQKKPGRKSPPCLVCSRSHRDRCPESQDIPLVLERRQQIATSNHPDNYKNMALAVLDRFLLDKQITPLELPKGKTAKNLSAAAARLGSSAYQDNLRSMSIGKAFVPTINPGHCIVCNQIPYHLPFQCHESKNIQYLQERCRAITLDPTIPDSKKQVHVETIKKLILKEAPPLPPRGHAGPTSAPPTSRRQAPWGASGPPGPPSSHNASSRNVPTSAAASVILAAAAASGGSSGSSSKHSGQGQRLSQSGQGHQAYSTQIPPQFMSSRPSKDGSHGSSSSSGQGASRHDGPRQREYNYNPRTMPPAAGPHMTIGARESSNYQPRKPAFRGDNGTIVVPSGRGGGSGGGHGTVHEYSGSFSNRDYGRDPPQGGDNYGRERDRERERERDRDHVNYGSRHGHPQEPRERDRDRDRERERDRERGHHQHQHHQHNHHNHHPDGRLDDVARSQQDFSQVDNGSYDKHKSTRYPQEPSSKQHRYPMSEHPPQQQHQHQQQHQRQQHPHHHSHQTHHANSRTSSRPRLTGSMSPPPRDDHRRAGQQQQSEGSGGSYGMENGSGRRPSGSSLPEREVVMDDDMTPPPLEPRQPSESLILSQQQQQRKSHQHRHQHQEKEQFDQGEGVSPRRDVFESSPLGSNGNNETTLVQVPVQAHE